MADRDLDITKFSYKAYRKLKKNLGEFDAVVECNEIAIREFIKNANDNDFEKYIKNLSSKHGVRVNSVDFLKFNSRIRHYYLASVFQQSEQFLKDFKEEWITYFPQKNWQDIKKGESGLKNTLRTLSINLPPDLMDFYEYYRLIRNYMAHTDRDIKEIQLMINKISKNKNEFLTDLHLFSTPNELESINFDDFLILTKVVKHIAFFICKNAKPENKIIAKILFDNTKNHGGKAYKGLKKLKNDKNRYHAALKSFIVTECGRISSEDMADIVVELECLLA